MLFQSGLAAIDFEIRPVRGTQRASVTGQVRVPANEDTHRVRLDGRGRSYEAAVDQQGMFEIEAVRRGDYEVLIHVGTTLLEIPTLLV